MALVDDQQRIARQIVEQARRRLAGLAAGQIARIVLDAGAVAHLVHHLHVEHRALFEALRFHQLVGRPQLRQPLAQLGANLIDGTDQPLLGRDVVRAGVDREARHLAHDRPGQRVEYSERVDRLVEQLHAHRLALGFGREDVDHIAAHAIGALRQVQLVARVLHVREAAQQPALVHAVATHQVQHHGEIGRRIAEAIDRRHGGHDDRIRSLEQRLGRRQAHLFDVLIDRRVLLDKRIARGHVGFRLIVVVIRDEILDRIVREELPELAVQLRRQSLVMRQHHASGAAPAG